MQPSKDQERENARIKSDKEKRVKESQRVLFGERYIGVSLSNLRAPKRAQETIVAFMNKKKNFLVYCGGPGIGKTYLCAALLEWGITSFNSFRYWHESDLLKKVRSSISDNNGDYLQVLKNMTDDELLIVDDIGSSAPNEWRNDLLFDLVDERYNSMKPTVFTSNYSIQEMKKVYHPRFLSRFFDKDNLIIEINDGDDLREPQINENDLRREYNIE